MGGGRAKNGKKMGWLKFFGWKVWRKRKNNYEIYITQIRKIYTSTHRVRDVDPGVIGIRLLDILLRPTLDRGVSQPKLPQNLLCVACTLLTRNKIFTDTVPRPKFIRNTKLTTDVC